ncbi:hypothetical protein T4E_4170, partial [Trichinella pseudospiralis]
LLRRRFGFLRTFRFFYLILAYLFHMIYDTLLQQQFVLILFIKTKASSQAKHLTSTSSSHVA